jgi:hypothetical protein
MDFLDLLSLTFPELREVLRTNHLPYTLAANPSVLVSWLLLCRKLRIDLARFPWLLESTACGLRPYAIATFTDSGPPVVGNPGWIDTFSDDPDLHLIVSVPNDFCPVTLALSFDDLSSRTRQFLLAPPTVCFENLMELPLPIRFVPDIHGRVLVKKNLACFDSMSGLETPLTETQPETVLETIFSAPCENTHEDSSSVSEASSDDVEEPWKRRPNVC